MAELIGSGIVAGASVEWAAVTDVGHVRKLNEDSVLVEPPLFVVADGMGGHDAGEVASNLSVERLRTLGSSAPIAIDAVAHELRHINSLLRNASVTGADAVMGTTTVGLAAVDNGGLPSWLVFNIGDSRAYSFADGELRRVSRDHSYVQELLDAEEIDEAEARAHPHRNVVTRALGADAEVKPDYWVRPLRPGERFLLCSDGLSGEVDDPVLETVLAAQLSSRETAQALLGLALETGGRDNISVAIVDVLAVPTWDESSTERNSNKKVVAEPIVVEPTVAEPEAVEPPVVETMIAGVPGLLSGPSEPGAHDTPDVATAAAISSVPIGSAVPRGEAEHPDPLEVGQAGKTGPGQPLGWPGEVVVGTGVDPVTFRFSGGRSAN